MDQDGHIVALDWGEVYTNLRKAAGVIKPGYMIHEAVRWNELERRWYFLPRRLSKAAYNDQEDEKRGTNIMMSMDESFGDIKVSTVGPLIETHGFSTFQFIPWRDNEFGGVKE